MTNSIQESLPVQINNVQELLYSVQKLYKKRK